MIQRAILVPFSSYARNDMYYLSFHVPVGITNIHGAKRFLHQPIFPRGQLVHIRVPIEVIPEAWKSLTDEFGWRTFIFWISLFSTCRTSKQQIGHLTTTFQLSSSVDPWYNCFMAN